MKKTISIIVALMMLTTIFQFMPSVKAENLDDWLYYKILPVENASNGYQMKINISKTSGGDVNCSGHCNDNFSDIRFTNLALDILPHWMESSVSSSYAIFWVNTSSDVETDNSIIMYYGNVNAIPSDDGDNTFLFFDDFSGTTLNTSKWTDNNGKATVGGGIMTFSPDASGNDFIFSTKIFSPDVRMKIYSKIRKPTETGYNSVWGFLASGKCIRGYLANTYNSMIFIDSTEVFISTDYNTNYDWSKKEITWDDTNSIVRWYENNTEKSNSPYTNGVNIPDESLLVHFAGCTDVQYVDWVFISMFSSTEPSIGIVSGENQLLGNQPPSFSNEKPSDESINQPLSLTWNITITDLEGDTFNWSIDCSNSQSNSSNNDINGSKELTISGLSYSTEYTVWVNATDGIDWTREWFTFQTASPNLPPTFGTPNPTNGSTGQSLSLTWNITIQDPNGDPFNWTIECSNGQSNSSDNDVNGSKELDISGLSYSTNYTVWVNATDGTNWTREWFTFTSQPLEDWDYYKILPIENSSNDYQMKINVTKTSGGDVNCSGHCNDNFSDIRFYALNKLNSLPYWIETYVSGSYATVWVNTSDNVENDDSILVYYGNINAVSTSNGSETFLLFDDFLGTDLNTNIWGGDTSFASVDSGILTFSPDSVDRKINSISDFSPDKIMRINSKLAFSSWKGWGFQGEITPRIVSYVDGSTNMMMINDVGQAEINTNWNTDNTYTTKQLNWSDSTDTLRFYENDIEKTNSPYTTGDNIPNDSLPCMVSRGCYTPAYIDWVFISEFTTPQPLWGSASAENQPIANLSPYFTNENPTDNSINQPLSLTWNITIEDVEGDLFNWTIECSNSDTNSSNGDVNGSKELDISGLSYSTEYTVWINATDLGSCEYTREVFTFITIPIPSFYSLNNLISNEITWHGSLGDTVWCDGVMEINMSVNNTENVTDINVFVGDLTDTLPNINSSNISLYISSDNSTFGYLGTFLDGGSNLTISSINWNETIMSTTPFINDTITNTVKNIYCKFKLTIPLNTIADSYISTAYVYILNNYRGLSYINGIYGSDSPNYLAGVQSLCQWGDYIFASAATNPSGKRLTVINITNPINPTFEGSTLIVGHNPRTADISNDGNYLYLGTDNTGSLMIFNVTDKSNPVLMGHVHLASNCAGSSYVDSIDICFVTSWGGDLFYSINCSNKTNPTVISSIGGTSYPHDVWANETRALTIGHNQALGGQFTTIDISNSSNMIIMDAYTTVLLDEPTLSRGCDIWYNEGTYAFVSSGGKAFEDNGGAFIFDVSNFSDIKLCSSISRYNTDCTLTQISNAFPNQNENLLFVTTANGYDLYSALIVMDISNKSNPIFITNISGGGSPNYLSIPGATGSFYYNGYIYIGVYFDNGISIFEYVDSTTIYATLPFSCNASVTLLPNNPPDKPTCVSPINNTTDISINTTLKCHVVDVDNDTMVVSFYWSNNTFIENFPNVISNSDVETINLSLQYGIQYSWYAMAYDGVNVTQSDNFTFTTESVPPINHAPNQPICISPINYVTNISINTKLKCHVIDIDNDNMTVTFYWFNNATPIQTINNVANDTDVETSNLSLEYNTSYAWNVIANDSQLENLSNTYGFTTELAPLPPGNHRPEAPTCVSPSDNETNTSVSTTLKVHVIDVDNDNMSVSFYWSDANLTQNPDIFSLIETVNNVLNNSDVETSSLGLDYSSEYYWYVTVNDSLIQNISDVFTFTTESLLAYPPWDINQDGVVNYLDISALVSHYGQSGAPGWIPEDINSDGFVNYLDVSSLVSHYGESY